MSDKSKTWAKALKHDSKTKILCNELFGDEGEAVQTLFSELCVYYHDKLGLNEMSTRYIAGLAMSGGAAAKHALEKAGLSPCSADQLRRFIAQAATNDEGRI